MQFEERRSVRSAFAGTAGGFVSAAIAPPGTTAPTDASDAPRQRQAAKAETTTKAPTRL